MYVCCVCCTSNPTSSRRCEHCPHIICEYCRCYGSWLDLSEDAADDSEPSDVDPGNEHQLCTPTTDSVSSGELMSTPKILERATLHQEVRERTRLALEENHMPWPPFTYSPLQGVRESLGVSTLGRDRRGTTDAPDRGSWESEVELAYRWGAESTCNFDWSPPADRGGGSGIEARTTFARLRLLSTISLPGSILSPYRHHSGFQEQGGAESSVMIRQAALKSIVYRLVQGSNREAVLRALMPLTLAPEVGVPALR